MDQLYREISSKVFENSTGVSATTDERTVLQFHSVEYEMFYTSTNCRITRWQISLFLTTAGELGRNRQWILR